MRRALGPETVRAVQKVLLVNGLQHHRDSTLEDFIFEGRNAERTHPPIALRDVHPPDGWRFVQPGFGALEKRLEVLL